MKPGSKLSYLSIVFRMPGDFKMPKKLCYILFKVKLNY